MGSVLSRHGRLPAGAPMIVRLNRKEIGDENAKLIASILISQFKGQIVIEHFGCYARPFHAALMRESRLIAGERVAAEVSAHEIGGSGMHVRRCRGAGQCKSLIPG